MTLIQYGLDKPLTSNATDNPTKSLADTEVETFTFDETQSKVFVQHRPDATADEYIIVAFNEAAATTNGAMLNAADSITSPDGIMVDYVSVYSHGGTKVNGTDFVIRGWR